MMKMNILVVLLTTMTCAVSAAQTDQELNLKIPKAKKDAQGNLVLKEKEKLPGENYFIDLQKIITPTARSAEDVQLDYLFGRSGGRCVVEFCFGLIPFPVGYIQSEKGVWQFIMGTTGSLSGAAVRFHFY